MGLTLGSLFDGSGGFPLAGLENGITPVWASEIEPYPVKVTAARLPQMKQLGDVTKINGAEIPPVDITTFGSPCQDVSVCGRRAGITEGSRSSLFFEAIRIIKEMRNGTTNQFPRFIVFENVPGMFSSNRGEDFRTVLQSLCDIGGGGVLQYLNLRSGTTQDASWEMVTVLDGACTTLNIGEYPRPERESTFLEISEVNVPDKYYLGLKGCAGILRRAAERKKILPPVLKEALEAVVFPM